MWWRHLQSQTILSKIKNEHTSWSTVWNAIKFVVIAYPSCDPQSYIKFKLVTTFLYYIKLSKHKMMPETSFPALVFRWFSRRVFLTSHSINWPNFTAWLLFLLEMLGNICIVIICFLVCDVINYRINLNVFLHNQKVNKQMVISQGRKIFLTFLKWF